MAMSTACIHSRRLFYWQITIGAQHAVPLRYPPALPFALLHHLGASQHPVDALALGQRATLLIHRTNRAVDAARADRAGRVWVVDKLRRVQQADLHRAS